MPPCKTLKGSIARVLVATCAGCEELAERIGLPLFHVDAVVDLDSAVRRLNERGHGSGVLQAHPFRPLRFEDGWRDWSEVGYPDVGLTDVEADGSEGVIVSGGRLAVLLPAGTTPDDLRLQLHATLRHLRMQEVVGRCSYRKRRFEEVLDHDVRQRFTGRGSGRDGGFDDATVVDDIYVVDPVATPLSLFWKAVVARAAAVSGSCL